MENILPRGPTQGFSPETCGSLLRDIFPTGALSCGQKCYLQSPNPKVTRVTGLQSPVKLEGRKPRVTMPSRDSLWSVDPNDVQVAEVDALFIHQGRAGAALGPAGPPGRTGRGLLPSALGSCAELGTQDRWGDKEQVSGRRLPQGPKAHWSQRRCHI